MVIRGWYLEVTNFWGCLRDLHFIKTGKRAKGFESWARLQVTGTEMANTILLKEKAGILKSAVSEGYMDNKQICHGDEEWRGREMVRFERGWGLEEGSFSLILKKPFAAHSSCIHHSHSPSSEITSFIPLPSSLQTRANHSCPEGCGVPSAHLHRRTPVKLVSFNCISSYLVMEALPLLLRAFLLKQQLWLTVPTPSVSIKCGILIATLQCYSLQWVKRCDVNTMQTTERDIQKRVTVLIITAKAVGHGKSTHTGKPWLLLLL